MPTLTSAQVRQYAFDAGFKKEVLPIVIAIAWQESKFNTDAVGDTSLADPPGGKWGPSIGLMQVRSLQRPAEWSGADAMRIAAKLPDPAYNMKTAYAIYQQKGNFNDWSTFLDRKKAGSGWDEALAKANESTVGWAGSVGDSIGESVSGAVDSVSDPLKSIGSLAAKVQDGNFWKRVGLGASGYGLILVGILFLLVSAPAAKEVAKTGGAAAVGLIPGGGTVKAVASGAKSAAKGAAK